MAIDQSVSDEMGPDVNLGPDSSVSAQQVSDEMGPDLTFGPQTNQPDNALVSPDYGQRVLKIEGTNPSKTSTAEGYGGFIDSTWLSVLKKEYPSLVQGKSDPEILAMRSNPEIGAMAVNALGRENAAIFSSKGVPVTNSTMYGAHFLGADGATKLFNADDNTPVDKFLAPNAIKSNYGTLTTPVKNADGSIVQQPKTAGEVKQIIAQKIGDSYFPQNLTAAQALEEGAPKLGPAIVKDAAGVAAFATDPSEWEPAAESAWNTMKGMGAAFNSKARRAAGYDDDPVQAAQVEAPLDRLIHYFPDTYGTWEGAYNKFAHEPDKVLSDLSMAIPGAGEVARMAGRTLGVGDLAGNAVRSFGKALNPLDPAGLTSKALDTVSGSGEASVIRGGSLVPSVINNLPADFTENDFLNLDPASKQQFINVLKQKGTSPEAVNEAILRASGSKAAASMVMGTAPPEGVREFVENVRNENNSSLARNASSMSGGVDDTSLGSSLEQAHNAQLEANKAGYDKVRAVPGSFGTSMNVADLHDAIDNQLSQYGGTRVQNLQNSNHASNQRPQTTAAIEMLEDSLGKGNYQASDATKGINAEEIMELRQNLSSMLRDANGTDQKSMGAVIDGFHDFVRNAENNGDFQLNGQATSGLIKPLEDANNQYKQYFDTFHNRDLHGGSVLSAAVKKLEESPGSPEVQQAVQASLENAIMNEANGAAVHRTLSKALGTSEPVDQLIRQRVFENDGDKLTPHTKIKPLIGKKGGVVEKAFANHPQNLAQARLLHAAHRLNNAKPKAHLRAHSMASGMFGRYALRTAAAIAGAHLYGGHELVGAGLGEIPEYIREKLVDKMAASKQLKGAPTRGNFLKPVTGAIKTAINPYVVRGADSQKPQSPIVAPALNVAQRYAGGRTERASGGRTRIDHEAKAASLIRLAERAKKDHGKNTKPLLNLPDETITKALSVANESI